MKNEDQWQESLYRMSAGHLVFKPNKWQSRYARRRSIRLHEEAITKHCQGRLLDLGCGRAPFYCLYREYADEIICVDWPNSPHNISHADFYCDLSQSIPLDSESVDPILITQVLEHVPAPDALFGEMARILRPNGKIILSVPFLFCIHEAPHDYYRYTEFALRRFCNTHGLVIFELTPTGGWFEACLGLTVRVFARTGHVGKGIAKLMEDFGYILSTTSLAQVLRQKTQSLFPSGYLLVCSKSESSNPEFRGARASDLHGGLE